MGKELNFVKKHLSRNRVRNILLKEAQEKFGLTFENDVTVEAMDVSLLRKSIGFRSHHYYNVWLAKGKKEINGSTEDLYAIYDMNNGNITVVQEENMKTPPTPLGQSFYIGKHCLQRVEENGDVVYQEKP